MTHTERHPRAGERFRIKFSGDILGTEVPCRLWVLDFTRRLQPMTGLSISKETFLFFTTIRTTGLSFGP